MGSYVEDAVGEKRFVTDDSGTADWITFVEPDDRDEDSDRFHRFGPELGFTDLGAGYGGRSTPSG